MPRETIKYLCDFKCGQRALNKKSDVEKHETKCWNNPANKSCKTCSNEIYKYDEDEVQSWIIRDCKLNPLSDALSNAYNKLKGNNQLHIRPVMHCKYHNQVEDADCGEYAINLAKVINATEGEWCQIEWPKQ